MDALVSFATVPGRHCTAEGCTRARRAGGTPHCKMHGGGRRCMFAGCGRSAASGGRPFCGKHGGGKRCSHAGCKKMARPGLAQGLLCAAHGGGKRCVHPGCIKSARAGNEQLCAAHGGGQRCAHHGCDKSAPDANNPFCVAHGGGKRCQEVGCTRSAASGGEFKLCVRHGGGRRCDVGGCDKGAVHRATLCIAHGGREAAAAAGNGESSSEEEEEGEQGEDDEEMPTAGSTEGHAGAVWGASGGAAGRGGGRLALAPVAARSGARPPPIATSSVLGPDVPAESLFVASAAGGAIPVVWASVTGEAAMDVKTGLMTPTSPSAPAAHLPCFTGAEAVRCKPGPLGAIAVARHGGNGASAAATALAVDTEMHGVVYDDKAPAALAGALQLLDSWAHADLSPDPPRFAAWTRAHSPDALAVALLHCWRRAETLAAGGAHASQDPEAPLRYRARRHGQLNPESRKGIPTASAAAASVMWIQAALTSAGHVEVGLRRRAHMDALLQALVATRGSAPGKATNGGGAVAAAAAPHPATNGGGGVEGAETAVAATAAALAAPAAVPGEGPPPVSTAAVAAEPELACQPCTEAPPMSTGDVLMKEAGRAAKRMPQPAAGA